MKIAERIAQDLHMDEVARLQDYHLAVWRGEAATGQVPVLCNPTVPMIFRSAGLSWHKVLTDMDCMLDFVLNMVHYHLRVKDDYIPMIRPEYGTYSMSSAFGVDFSSLLDDPSASIKPVLSRSDVEKLEKPDIKTAGILPRLFETFEFFLRNVPAGVRVGQANLQGHYNTAWFLRGHDLLLDLYDCPELVHHLLDVITDTYIAANRMQKDLLGEDGYTAWTPYRGTTGVFSTRITECSVQLISADMYREFVLPYDSRIAREFGPVHIHICGQSLHHVDGLLEIPGLVGFEYNFHEMPTVSMMPKINDRVVQIRQGSAGTDHTGNPREELLQRANVSTVEDIITRELDQPGRRAVLDLTDLPDVDTGRRLCEHVRSS